MLELDEQIRQDLANLRERQGPSSAVEQRMLAALELKLGGPSGPEGLGGDSSGLPPDVAVAAPALDVAFAAKVVTATLALTGAGVLALRLAVIAVRAVSPEPAPEQEPQLQLAPASTQPKPAPPIATEVVAPEIPESFAAPPSFAPTAKSDGRATAGQKRDATEPVDDLAAELALLEAAHAASSPTAALAELERHRDRFPTGSLADEREVLRIEVLCELGRTDAARTVAERLLAARPNSPLRPRVHAACPALGLDHGK